MPGEGATIERMDFVTDEGLGTRVRIGLIVLQSDQTIEDDFRTLMPREGVVLHHVRIPNADNVSPETLRRMEQDLPRAAALLPARIGFDAIGYGCTSGATLIGEERVARIVRGAHPGARVSDPLTAVKAALEVLDLRHIALVTPYPAPVTCEMQDTLRAAGVEVAAVASFDQSDDFTVARIAPASILDAVLRVGARGDCDGVFVSCTSLRATRIIAEAESHLNKPVVASNQALAWHLMRLTGLTEAPEGAGRLFHTGL